MHALILPFQVVVYIARVEHIFISRLPTLKLINDKRQADDNLMMAPSG